MVPPWEQVESILGPKLIHSYVQGHCGLSEKCTKASSTTCSKGEQFNILSQFYQIQGQVSQKQTLPEGLLCAFPGSEERRKTAGLTGIWADS